MLASLYLSFTRLQPDPGAGVDRYRELRSGCSSDARLHKSLQVTFTYVFVGVPLQLIVALGIAIC